MSAPSKSVAQELTRAVKTWAVRLADIAEKSAAGSCVHLVADAADRLGLAIDELTEECEQQTTRAEAAEAELRELREQMET